MFVKYSLASLDTVISDYLKERDFYNKYASSYFLNYFINDYADKTAIVSLRILIKGKYYTFDFVWNDANIFNGYLVLKRIY